MDKDAILEIVLEKISENQLINGIVGSKIDQTIHPIGDLDNFDSMTAMEVLVEVEGVLEEEYGIKTNLDISVVFIKDSKSCLSKGGYLNSLTALEIASNIHDSINS